MFRRKLGEVRYYCAEASTGKKGSLWVELQQEGKPATVVRMRRSTGSPLQTESPREVPEAWLAQSAAGELKRSPKCPGTRSWGHRSQPTGHRSRGTGHQSRERQWDSLALDQGLRKGREWTFWEERNLSGKREQSEDLTSYSSVSVDSTCHGARNICLPACLLACLSVFCSDKSFYSGKYNRKHEICLEILRGNLEDRFPCAVT